MSNSSFFSTIRSRLTYGTLALALVPLTIAVVGLAWFAINSSREALEQRAYEQLRITGQIVAREVEQYVNGTADELRQLATARTIVEGAAQMPTAFSGLARSLPIPVTEAREKVRAWYSGRFLADFQKANVGAPPDLDRIVSSLSDDAVALQYLYIVQNPDQDDRSRFMDAGDGSTYSQLHARIHREVTDVAEHSRFTDLHIADARTGYLVYTTSKEPDIGTNLLEGPLKATGMAEAFRQVRQASERHAAWMSEYEPFYPALGETSSFIATPIYDPASGDITGVLIGQFPIDDLNQLMTYGGQWREFGLGDSGETYLVGADKVARSVSRFLTEDRDGFLALMKSVGESEENFEKMRVQGTNVGIQTIDTEGVRRSIRGESGVAVFPDYRNIPVLGYYTPVRFLNITWSLHSEIDEEEAFRSVTQLRNGIVIAGMVSITLLGLIALLSGGRLSSSINVPLSQLGQVVDRVAKGDREVRARMSSGDEIGQLARRLRQHARRAQRGAGAHREGERRPQQLGRGDHDRGRRTGQSRPHDQGAGGRERHRRGLRRHQHDVALHCPGARQGAEHLRTWSRRPRAWCASAPSRSSRWRTRLPTRRPRRQRRSSRPRWRCRRWDAKPARPTSRPRRR
jgi:methyl-accepting chemotaxis protein